MTEKRNQNKVVIPKITLPKAPRIPRGPTIRWDIDYAKLFRGKKK